MDFYQRCERPQTKNKENTVKLGKIAKNRLKVQENIEILAQENFQKWGNQLKSSLGKAV